MKDKPKQIQVNADDLFRKYMYIMCEKESEKTYRLKSGAGEGIMHNYEIASGIELVYSELESYYPVVKEIPECAHYIEIMYMVEGHAEFEMENRRVSSANKGDVCIFNSRIGAKKISFGKGGMRSVSIVLLIDTLKDELDRFFETKEFGNKPLFEYALNLDSCICFAANEMLCTIFTDMVLLPEEYSEYHRKLLVIRAILSLLDMKTGKTPATGIFPETHPTRFMQRVRSLEKTYPLIFSLRNLLKEWALTGRPCKECLNRSTELRYLNTGPR